MNANVSKLLNEQINKEFYSAYLYLDFANYYAAVGLDGFENWYRVQAQEERDHAMLFYQYLQNNGEGVTFEAIAKPEWERGDHMTPLKKALEHEQYVTSLINGIYANENAHLLMEILRRDWGFDGAVVTDWGGSNDHALGVKNGSTLEMPAPGGDAIRELMKAVQTGKITEADVDARLEELLELVEMEVRELLDFYGFPGDDTPIIRGSALNALVSESKDPNAPEYACIKELMDAVDSYIPTPDRAADKPFLMPVEDVFTISGRGTVVTGRVERGKLPVNSNVEIVGIRPTQTTTVTSIETFHKQMDECEAGDNTGLLLRGINRDQVERGQVLAAPGSVTPHTKFEGEVYVLTKDEGGRHSPFFSNYRPQFYFRTTDVTGVITLPEGTEMCMPGDNVDMNVELITPIAIENGLRFAIREGGRTVGSGVVGKIIE